MSRRGPVFKADGLRRHYDGRAVVEDFSANVDSGEVVVLVGPNGCGKTTSVEMGIGLRHTEAGYSSVAGLDPRTHRREVARVIGVQLQGTALHPRVRVREHLQYLGALYGSRRRPFEIAETLGLQAELKRFYGALSGGQQRRVLVATAIAGSPRFALLDEPTSGVDIESRIEFWSALRSLMASGETGVLVTTHDLVEAERHADRVLIMRDGRVAADGSPQALIDASGLVSVLTLRLSGAVRAADIRAAGGLILQSSATDATVGFRHAAELRAVREWAGAAGGVRVAERLPTLEDAYLLLGATSSMEGAR